MRRKKNRSRLLPFGAGLAAGYLLTIGVAAAGALVMWLTGADKFHGVADGGSGGGAWELPLRQDCGEAAQARRT